MFGVNGVNNGRGESQIQSAICYPELSQHLTMVDFFFLKSQRKSLDSQTVLGDKCKRFLK